MSVFDDNIAVAKLLLEEEANPNLADKTKNTPLHEAVEANFSELAKLLLEYKADPNLKNNENLTAREIAFQSGKTDDFISLRKVFRDHLRTHSPSAATHSKSPNKKTKRALTVVTAQ